MGGAVGSWGGFEGSRCPTLPLCPPGLVWQLPRLLGPAGAQRCEMPPETQQRGQQLHGQPALRAPATPRGRALNVPITPPSHNHNPPLTPSHSVLATFRALGGRWGMSAPPQTLTVCWVGVLGHLWPSGPSPMCAPPPTLAQGRARCPPTDSCFWP